VIAWLQHGTTLTRADGEKVGDTGTATGGR
jgi:hypothetical protein